VVRPGTREAMSRLQDRGRNDRRVLPTSRREQAQRRLRMRHHFVSVIVEATKRDVKRVQAPSPGFSGRCRALGQLHPGDILLRW
jgi:hypothetical protein